MKARLSILILSTALAVASAQEKPQNPPSQDTPQRATPNPQPDSKTQPDAKTSTMPGSDSTKLPEMKTTTFKGVLVDMSCASGTSASAGSASGAGKTTESADVGKAPAAEQPNTANRSAGDSGANCPVTAASSQLGLKMDDGKTVRFDLVGNQRAQDALKNDKRWNKELSANKPLRVKVSGVLNGDKLIVASIH